MHRQYNEDLFESSKMTFGEHLDELRLALVKTILSFVIGFLIALIFAGQLVDYVQTPLRSALKEYYGTMAEHAFRNSLTGEGDAGEETAKSAADAAKRLRDQGLEFEERWVSKQEINKLRDGFSPKTEAKPPVVAASPNEFLQPDDLLKLHIYRRLEDDPRVRVIGLRVDEPFVVYMKAAVMLGAVLASPFIFYFIWQFVAAGLYPHEQRYVHIFLPFSLALFLPGDYNTNQAVDAADFVIWRKTKGSDVPQYAGADGSGNSKIDDADYDVWRGSFGAASSGSGTAATSQPSLVTVEAQGELPSAPPSDLALNATFISHSGLLLAHTDSSNHSRLSKVQTTSAVSRQARDEALLALTAESHERRISNDKSKSPNSEFELDAVNSHFGDSELSSIDSLTIRDLAVHCERAGLPGQE